MSIGSLMSGNHATTDDRVIDEASNETEPEVSAEEQSPPDPMFDFDDEPRAIAELQRRIAGLPHREASPIIIAWEMAQRASIWRRTPGAGTSPAPSERGRGFNDPRFVAEWPVA